MPLVQPGDDLAGLILEGVERAGEVDAADLGADGRPERRYREGPIGR